jgi:hypothetical protein
VHCYVIIIANQRALYVALVARQQPSARFSQALELGIGLPKLRNGAAAANSDTLIYFLLNLRTLQRLHRRNPATTTPASMPEAPK